MAQNTYRLTISYNAAGQFAQNILHYRFDDALFADTILAGNSLNNAFALHCGAALKDCLSTNTKVLSYKARRITAAGGFEAVKLGGIGDVGTRAGDLSASGLAPLIRLITNNIPIKTGRIFLPGVSDNDCTDGEVTPTYFTDLTSLANVLDDSLSLIGGGAPTATPVLYSLAPVKDSIPIHIAVPCTFLATQRKRQRPA